MILCSMDVSGWHSRLLTLFPNRVFIFHTHRYDDPSTYHVHETCPGREGYMYVCLPGLPMEGRDYAEFRDMPVVCGLRRMLFR